MPALSFSIFKEKILDGTKRQTIRPFGKMWKFIYEFHKDNKLPLYLYWKQRTKESELLRIEHITEMIPIKMRLESNDDVPNGLKISKKGELVLRKLESKEKFNALLYQDVWQKDGFEHFLDFDMFFINQYKLSNKWKDFVIIRWQKMQCLKCNKAFLEQKIVKGKNGEEHWNFYKYWDGGVLCHSCLEEEKNEQADKKAISGRNSKKA